MIQQTDIYRPQHLQHTTTETRTRKGHGAHAPVRVHVRADHVELRVAEGVHPHYRHGLVWLSQMPPAQDPEERGLARAVGAYQEAAVVCFRWGRVLGR